jgi:hypothetical protein
MTIESETKTLNEQLAVYNTEAANAFPKDGKMNKQAVKRARAALNEIKKASANLRKLLQEQVNEATLKAASGKS